MTAWRSARSEALAALIVPPLVMLAVGWRGMAVLAVWAFVSAVVWMLIVCTLPDARWRSEAAAVAFAASLIGVLAAASVLPS